jgi:hypothetical protein
MIKTYLLSFRRRKDLADYFDPLDVEKIAEEVFSLLIKRGIEEKEFIMFFTSGTSSLMLLNAGFTGDEINPDTDCSIGEELFDEITKTGQRFINRLRDK